MGRPKNTIERVLSNCDLSTGCWLWNGAVFNDGYAAIRWDHHQYRGHRLLYELLVGPIPDKKQLDHLCRVRRCINPDHLEPVTCRENLLRGQTLAAKNAAKTHCPQGHEYTPQNILKKAVGRSCRQCNTEYLRRQRALRKTDPPEL